MNTRCRECGCEGGIHKMDCSLGYDSNGLYPYVPFDDQEDEDDAQHVNNSLGVADNPQPESFEVDEPITWDTGVEFLLIATGLGLPYSCDPLREQLRKLDD